MRKSPNHIIWASAELKGWGRTSKPSLLAMELSSKSASICLAWAPELCIMWRYFLKISEIRRFGSLPAASSWSRNVP
ncbi:hypothetical protein IV203_002195 [Nitzschia inconspicua]|uniref:Uncharacterized protein n=1 Tax=Nitzschia inconspicua TaxID=303405 RepID=A0A9K3PS04_9STRA|nr:hypothetical protein IV203_002195 [Nitzschia inconspicua]